MNLRRKITAVVLLVVLSASAISVSSFYHASPTHPAGPSSGPAGISSSHVNTGNTIPLSDGYVTFSESGLPTGSTWTVFIAGAKYSGDNSTIAIALPGGNYSYIITNSLDFFTSSPSGRISINGTGITVDVQFQGQFSISSYVNLNTRELVGSTSSLSGNRAVFPVYGTYDSFSNAFLVVGFANSMVYELNQYNLSQITSFKVSASPSALAYNTFNGNIYVINSTLLSVYDAGGGLLYSVQARASPVAVAYDPANNQVMLGLSDGTMDIYNATTMSRVATMNGVSVLTPQSFSYVPGTGSMEIANDYGMKSNILTIASNDTVSSVVGTIGSITSLIYAGGYNETYYTSISGNGVNTYVLNQSGSFRILGPELSSVLGYDSATGTIIVSDSLSGSITMINAFQNSVVYTVQDSGTPSMPLTLPGHKGMLILNPYSDSLDVVALTKSVQRLTFNETGLPGGASWGISVNSYAISSMGSSITFYESPGNISYSVTPAAGYAASASGYVVLGEAGITVELNFHRIYSVVFNESGIASGATWSVGISGATHYAMSPAGVTFNLENGTYNFTVGNSGQLRPSPSTGILTVNGSSLHEMVNFSASVYQIQFISTGLPSGLQWSMQINGIQERPHGATLEYQATPGTYNYSIAPLENYYPSVSRGAVAVSGSNVTVNVTWLPYLYEVNFTQDSLPAGSTWYLNISGGPHVVSLGENATVFLQDGVYTYTASSMNKSFEGTSGALRIDRAPVEIGLAFALLTYNLTFSESGLPSGTIWHLGVGSSYSTTSLNQVTLSLPNGTYAFSATPSNSSFLPVSGSITISGSQVSVPIEFTLKVFTVEFIETGLPANLPWGIVTGGNAPEMSSVPTLNVSLPVGTYSYTPVPVSGYNSSGPGTFILSGNTTIDVTYTLIPVPALRTYNVSVMEMGLRPYFTWGVIMNGSVQEIFPGGAINFSLPNGTYNMTIFSMLNGHNYIPGDATFQFQVNGTSLDLVALFYGPYVWIVFEFPIHHFHDHDRDNSGGDHEQQHGNDNVIAVPRFRP